MLTDSPIVLMYLHDLIAYLAHCSSPGAEELKLLGGIPVSGSLAWSWGAFSALPAQPSRSSQATCSRLVPTTGPQDEEPWDWGGRSTGLRLFFICILLPVSPLRSDIARLQTLFQYRLVYLTVREHVELACFGVACRRQAPTTPGLSCPSVLQLLQ